MIAWFNILWISVAISLVPSSVIAALKGRRSLLIAGLMGVFPLLWVAAIKIASPTSWWAQRFYESEKLQRARDEQSRWDERWAE